MSVLKTDTIAALATPPGRSSVAMFRISGPDAFGISDRIITARKPTQDYSTQSLHRALVVAGENDTVDDVLVAVFHAPRSYTGENVVEITCHGGSVPVRRIMELLLASGARLAEPGEFTLRAFLNGKLDLAQAEAVCDTIGARTDEAYRLAQAQQSGRLSAEVNALRDTLLGLVARIEATIDFPEDVGEFPEAWARGELVRVTGALDKLIASAGRGMLYRDGIRVALAGRPNAGKSSLLNALLRADRAIVTPIAGTTRDVIEESINIHGIPVRLSDTAGLRATADEVERLGVERTRATVASADIVVMVKDATEPCDLESDDDLDPNISRGRSVTVCNKIDIASDQMRRCCEQLGAMAVSALTGEGIERLEDKIAELALSGVSAAEKDSGGATVTHARHKAALEQARESVGRALNTLDGGMPLDFLSIEVQSALSEVGLVTGQTAPQDIVGEIFSKFCIGK